MYAVERLKLVSSIFCHSGVHCGVWTHKLCCCITIWNFWTQSNFFTITEWTLYWKACITDRPLSNFLAWRLCYCRKVIVDGKREVVQVVVWRTSQTRCTHVSHSPTEVQNAHRSWLFLLKHHQTEWCKKRGDGQNLVKRISAATTSSLFSFHLARTIYLELVHILSVLTLHFQNISSFLWVLHQFLIAPLF